MQITYCTRLFQFKVSPAKLIIRNGSGLVAIDTKQQRRHQWMSIPDHQYGAKI